MTDMSGKMVMVTGATNGIGEVTARELARMGAYTIVVGRDREKGERVAGEIQRATGSEHVDLMLADLSSMEAVRQLAADFKAKHDRLDVLVNNAGAIFLDRRTTVDGYEMTFALNHLGPFLLTNLLLETLKASAPARIVNVSSDAHYREAMDFDDVMHENGYRGMTAYSQSKLANVLFTYELARRLEGTGVTVNAVHPGIVRTGFGDNHGVIVRALMSVIKRFAGRSPEKGAETMIYLASSPDVEGVTGKYFMDNAAKRSSDVSYDETSWERLWTISEELTGLRVPAS